MTLALMRVVFFAQLLGGVADDPLISRVDLLLSAGKNREAIELLEPAVGTSHARNPAAFVLLAAAYEGERKLEEAILVCERGLLNGLNGSLESEYVRLLGRGTDPKVRRAKLEEWAARRPGSPAFQKALGYLLMKDNLRDPRAEALLAGAARGLPKDPEARFLYGQLACLTNREILCVSELKSVLFLGVPNDSARMQIFTLIGVAEQRLNHPEEAEQAFQAALKSNRALAPPDPGAAYQYVKFLLEQGKNDEAGVVLQEILAWAPDFGPAHYEKARELSRAGRYREAAAQGEVAMKTLERDDPSLLPAAHAFMARTYFALRDVEKAKLHKEWIEKNRR